MPRLYYLGDINIPVEWERFMHDRTYSSNSAALRGFRRYLKTRVHPCDTGLVDRYVRACVDCRIPQLSGNMYSAYTARGMVCINCYTNYAHCRQCGVYYNRNTVSNVRRHAHVGRQAFCCQSAQTQFTVRNGDESLANDTRLAISLPEGEISEEGINSIAGLINQLAINKYYEGRTQDRVAAEEEYKNWCALVANLSELGNKWQTKGGNYPKRLSRLAYKKYGLKVPTTLMTRAGNIASDHSKGVDYEIEFTRKLNLSARAFVHGGSCWWSSYGQSRCILKTNGGMGLRAFQDDRAVGRAWVMPLKSVDPATQRYNTPLTPTYETHDAAAYLTFNGYGTLQGYNPARILAHMFGLTYRKVQLNGHGMYINGDSGYIVGTEEIVAPYTDGVVTLPDPPRHSRLYQNEQQEAENLRRAEQTAAAVQEVADNGITTFSWTRRDGMIVNA